MKKLTSWNDLKKGRKFRVLKNHSAHNYPLNVTFTLTRDGVSDINMDNVAEEYKAGNYININEIQCLPATLEDLIGEKMDLIKESKIILNKIELIEDRIKFMTDYDLKEFDEEEFQIYQILKIVESPSTSKLKKVDLIRNILKNS